MQAQDSAHEAREIRILTAASQLIAHYGYDKTTVADIAKAAGISKGAVYLHFNSKEQLFVAVLYYESAQILQTMLERIEADPDGGTIYSFFSHSLMAIALNPMMKALTTGDKRVLGEYFRNNATADLQNQARGLSLDFLKQFQTVGLIRDDLPDETLLYVTAIVRYGFLTVDAFIPSEYVPSLEAFSPTLGDMVQRLLQPKDASAITDAQKQAGKAIINHWITSAKHMMTQHRLVGIRQPPTHHSSD